MTGSRQVLSNAVFVICRARDWVAETLDIEHDAKLNMFETIIRVVGGLLAAYDATGDQMFLSKAQQLASKMLTNFKTGTMIAE